MGVTYIYGLREPDTQLVRYIGKTIDPHRRWLNHLCEKSKTRRAYWVQSLERRGLRPEMVIIEEIFGAWPWQESERFWIAFARANNWPLVNMTDGGDGITGDTQPRKYSGDSHWTRKKPERVARGDRNGARRHPDLILRGDQCPASRLRGEQVAEIRRLAADGLSHQSLAAQFHTSRRNVWNVVNRKWWKHVN